ncbi:hypothetical protein GCM10009682_31080 [Luedemannella flava]|uniref:4,4'-diaponeurosporenoate glycosyltransferase n=1 Tax=Luedemannella flava TaxID=349316 RepID=A0ABN2M3U9_9ACTN
MIIPAYNEEAGIAETLRALVHAPDFGPDIEVIVAANGCRDRTADVARGFGVKVVEIEKASKTAAINAAEEVATGWPRIYLDADIALAPQAVRALGEALATPGVHAAVPRPVVDVDHSSWLVRAYYDVNAQLPVFRGRLFGRGVIAISRSVRERFDEFPDIIADDLFLDAVVAADAKREVDVPVRVPAPRSANDLVNRLARAREGNEQFQAWARAEGEPQQLLADPVKGSSSTSWLRDVVLPAPRLWPAAVCYVAMTALAARRRRSPNWTPRAGWGRPESGAPEPAGEVR